MHYTTTIRNRDFISACRREAMAWNREKDGAPTVDKVVSRVLEGRAPRFYVGYEQAYRHACNYRKLSRRGETPAIADPMWADFYRAIEREMEREEMTLGQAVVNVIDGCDAPSFYISLSTGRRLYFAMRRARKAAPKPLNL